MAEYQCIESAVHKMNARQKAIIRLLEDMAIRHVQLEKRIRNIELIIARKKA
jgi:hypothetical protein